MGLIGVKDGHGLLLEEAIRSSKMRGNSNRDERKSRFSRLSVMVYQYYAILCIMPSNRVVL